MIRFKLTDYQLELTPDVLLVAEFKAILDADKSKHKEEAMKDLKFVFLTRDKSKLNPYKDTDPKDLDTICMREAYGSSVYKIPSGRQYLIDQARDKYIKLNKTADHRAVAMLNSEIDAYIELLTSTAGSITPAVAEERQKISLGIEKLIKSRKAIESVIEEESANTKNRGGVTESPMEDGSFTMSL